MKHKRTPLESEFIRTGNVGIDGALESQKDDAIIDEVLATVAESQKEEKKLPDGWDEESARKWARIN